MTAGKPKNYSSAPKASGVYSICCLSNSRAYIGSSRNIRTRMSQHLSALRAGTHQSGRLQFDFDLYGATAFECFFEECSQRDRIEVEQRRIVEARQKGLSLYNTRDASTRPATTDAELQIALDLLFG